MLFFLVLSPRRALWTSCKIEFPHSFVFMWTSQALHCQSAQLAPKAEAKMFSNSNIFFTGQALISITLLLLYGELKCLPVVEIKTGKKHFKISVPPQQIKTHLGVEFSEEKCYNLGFKWLISISSYFPPVLEHSVIVSCVIMLLMSGFTLYAWFPTGPEKKINEKKGILNVYVIINGPFNAVCNHECTDIETVDWSNRNNLHWQVTQQLTKWHWCHSQKNFLFAFSAFKKER